MENYLRKVTTNADKTVIENVQNILAQETKKWEANQYYFFQLKSAQEQKLYLEEKSYKEQFKLAFKQKAHADKQSMICLKIMKDVLNNILKKKVDEMNLISK